MRTRLAFLVFAALAMPAHAADPQIIEAPQVDPVRFGWDGFYAGGSAGYGWLRDVDNSFVPPFPDHGDDWVFGAHLGYLHQFGSMVAGLEFEYTNLDIRFERAPFVISGDELFVGKLRAGYAWERLLVSGFVGLAYATTTLKIDGEGFGVGLNVDYALTDNFTIGAQYGHYDFNNVDKTRIDANLDIVTARFGIKF